jgi:hypothetical protein
MQTIELGYYCNNNHIIKVRSNYSAKVKINLSLNHFHESVITICTVKIMGNRNAKLFNKSYNSIITVIKIKALRFN